MAKSLNINKRYIFHRMTIDVQQMTDRPTTSAALRGACFSGVTCVSGEKDAASTSAGRCVETFR